MMAIKPDEANRVLVIETRGMISEADIDKAFADLESLVSRSAFLSTGNN